MICPHASSCLWKGPFLLQCHAQSWLCACFLVRERLRLHILFPHSFNPSRLDLFSVCLSGLSLPPASLSSLRLSQGFELLWSFPFAVLATFSKVSFQSFLSSSIFCLSIVLSLQCVSGILQCSRSSVFNVVCRATAFVTRAHKSGELRANAGERWRTLANSGTSLPLPDQVRASPSFFQKYLIIPAVETIVATRNGCCCDR